MKNWWIRFGCFLTGYNYNIVNNSSEVAAKTVKRYTAALIIVSILWCFIGYSFTDRYIHAGLLCSIIGALLFVIIIIQIERQIILSISPTKWLYWSRGVIAILMATIGSIIIDQIIFKEDIELEKTTYIEERVKKALGPKTEELRIQIAKLDSIIQVKELESANLLNDIARNPTIPDVSTNKTTSPGPNGQNLTSTTVIRTNIANPKIEVRKQSDETIKLLRVQKFAKDSALLNIRPQLEKEISSKIGFLDELKIMYSLINESNVALAFYLIWFFFLFGLEMLVLISKVNEKENDYEKTVKHHMDLQIRRLELMAAQMSEKNDY